MPTPILATKLYIPRPRPDSVARPRLIKRMDEGLHGKLTLICAPAGFGKTTLVGTWITGSVRPVAWLALDAEDAPLVRFLVYVIAALQTVAPGLGEGVLAALQSPQPPDPMSALTTLLNQISAIPDPVVLVLDDYHVIDDKRVDDALTFLLDHLPPQMHMVMTTREDPRLPLARLRARGQLTEIRAADLRFTENEAADFLNQAMGLHLTAEDVAALESRTEGWIAGLQLAALALQGLTLQGPISMPGRDHDIHGFVQTFAGDHRYIVDYLVDEVLARQPDQMRAFLLQTSILERLNGPLCDTVTGQEGSRSRLVALERNNLFVVPLDETRHWFRYHHLFADVLRAHLRVEQPDQIATLHRRASQWYEQNDLYADAIRHALAAEDFEHAATLIERQWHTMDANLQSEEWLRWAQALPAEVVQDRPVLSLGCAWALLNEGSTDAAEIWLRDAERWLDPTTAAASQRPGQMVVIDEVVFGKLAASIAAARAYAAQSIGNAAATVAYARQALDLLPPDDDVGRRVPAAILGLVQWQNGDLDAAYRSLSEALASFERTGHIIGAVSGTFGLADICITQGRLRTAGDTYRHALQLVAGMGDLVFPGVAELHVGLGEFSLECGDLDAASRHMQRGQDLGEQAVLPGDAARLYAVMARIQYARGAVDAAFQLFDEAERLFIPTPVPNVRPVAAWRARFWISAGRIAEAQGWARQSGLTVDDELHYLTEFEHLTLARLLLAQARSDGADHAAQALNLLGRLLSAADEGGRMGSAIEILVLQALVHQAQNDVTAALEPLARALTLAEPQGYVQVFVDKGPSLAELLRTAAKQEIAPTYARHLLTFFGDAAPSAPTQQDLIEPLSDRELDVVRLLATELTGPEIARELVISLNTLRTHTKNIYSKLGVGNRRAAVRHAKECHLL